MNGKNILNHSNSSGFGDNGDYRHLVDILPTAVFVCDREGCLRFCNKAAIDLWGRAPKIGEEYWSGAYRIYRVDGSQLALDECPMAMTLKKGECVSGEEIIVERPDGGRRYVVACPELINDSSGIIIGAINILIDITERKRVEVELAAAKDNLAVQASSLEEINKIGRTLAGELDLNKLVQALTDAGRAICGAEFAAFFYVHGDEKPQNILYALSGAPREAFDKFGIPRMTPLFAPTFQEEKIIRLRDVLIDPHYGKMPPHFGMPKGHLPVRSYLAMPVISRTGKVLGALLFGHSKPDMFTKHAEETLAGIAAQAATAIDNANLYEAVQKELTKHKQIEEELFKSNRELEQFAYIASHDLQEPLHMINSFVDLLLRRCQDKLGDQETEYLSFIKEGSKQAKTLIQDLLEYSRVGKGSFGEVNLQYVIKEVESVLKMMIQELSAVIRCQQLPIIRAGHMEMVQLFQNLISNAIKYRSQEPPEIDISCSRKDANMWLFTVKDNGIGIDPQYKERIFAMFQRLHPKSQYSGTGIGLAICKKIVEYHGGKIWVESEKGKGAAFHFTLAG